MLLLLAVIIFASGCSVVSGALTSDTKQASLTVEKSNAVSASNDVRFTGKTFTPTQPVPYKLQTIAFASMLDDIEMAANAPAANTPEDNILEANASESNAPSANVPAVSTPEASALEANTPPFETITDKIKEPEVPEMPEDDRPMIALTFDDGPARKITPQIIALLEEYDAHATFCVVGNMLETRMDIGELIFQSGNEMIGHSWNHSYLTKLSAYEIERQLLDTNALIEKITGSAPVLFRPPYGAVNTRVRETAEKLGMSLLLWSIDPKDWKYKNATVTYEHILANVKEGSIILCHDLYDSTLEMVKMLVPELTRQGYRFVTVSELLAETEILPGKSYSSKK